MNSRKRSLGCAASRALILGAGLFLAAPPISAWAQAATQVAQAAPAGLEEVVVTARKRAELIESVPVAVTAIGGAQLRTAAVRNVFDLEENTPGLVIRGSGASANNPDYFIRGQGDSFGTPPGVIVYFDDTSLGNFGSNAFFDLSSVQVLKGPQGTLFGRSTTGGAIIFTPQKPGDEYGGFIDGTFGNLNARQFQGAIDVPLWKDKLNIRLAANSEQRDGYTTSLTTGEKFDDRNRQSYRIGIDFKPVHWFDNYTLLQESRSDEDGGSNVLIDYNPNLGLWNTTPGGQGYNTVAGICAATSGGNATAAASCMNTRLGLLNQLRNGYAAEFARIQAGGAAAQRFEDSGTLNGPDRSVADNQLIVNTTTIRPGEVPILGDVSIKNIYSTARTLTNTAFRSIAGSSFENGRNYTGVNWVNGVYQPNPATPFGLNYTEELQVSGNIPGFLNWLVGYYDQETNSGNIKNTPPYFSSFNGAFSIPLGQPPILGNFSGNSHSYEKGYFGQGTLDLSRFVHGLHLTGGYRRTDSFSVSSTFAAVFTPNAAGGTYSPGAQIGQPFPFQQSADSYTLTLDWQVDPNLLLYIAHRKGFKPGGVNGQALTLTSQIPGLSVIFGPEVVKDVEIGAKDEWTFNGVRGRTNFAAYYQDYTGLQRSETFANTAPPFQTFTATANIGAARIYGFELENLVRLTDRLTVTFNYAYISAKYTKYPGTTTDTNGVVHQNIDTPYIGVAPNQITLEGRYRLPTPDGMGDLFISGQLYAQSGVWLDDSVLLNPIEKEGYQPPYHDFNARLDWDNVRGNPIDISLFVHNIGDESHLVAVANFLPNLGAMLGEYSEPRTFGIEVRARFGANAR